MSSHKQQQPAAAQPDKAVQLERTIALEQSRNAARSINAQVCELQKQLATSQAVIKDDCETDTNVRELARPILGDFAVDGDSYGVPGLGDITESLIAELERVKASQLKLRGTINDQLDELERVKAQRDALLAALRSLVENTRYNMTEEQSMEHAMDAHDADQCVLCGAEAAIAAAEGRQP